MDRIFTHELLCLEEEATCLLSVYESYDDDMDFGNANALEAISANLKSFARSFQFVKAAGCNVEYNCN